MLHALQAPAKKAVVEEEEEEDEGDEGEEGEEEAEEGDEEGDEAEGEEGGTSLLDVTAVHWLWLCAYA